MNKSPTQGESPAKLIDARIKELGDWRGQILAHVRALVRRLGGDITVSSELGRGSTFRIDLPARLRPTDNS